MRNEKITFEEESHKYFVNGVEMPSVTTILGLLTKDHYGAINTEVLRQAAQKGSDVHELCEMIDLGMDIDEDERLDNLTGPYVDAYLQFLQDYQPEWYEIEQMHYNKYHGYCGTVDRMGVIDGAKVLLDIKTTASPNRVNYITYLCQLVAYEAFYNGGMDRKYILFLRKDGTYRLVDYAEYYEKIFKKNRIYPLALFHDCLRILKEMEKLNG